MKLVISANSHDRNAPNKWLTHNSDESADDSVERVSIVAKNVRFHRALEEVGFGCSVIAECESEDATINPTSEPSLTKRLKFNGANFEDENGVEIGEVEELFCDSTGHMWYR